MNVIITTGFGSKRYTESVKRMQSIVQGAGEKIFVLDASMAEHIHSEVPYGFKPFWVQTVAKSLGWNVLWLDSVIIPDMSRIKEIWELIEQKGVLAFQDPEFKVGQWSTDDCLRTMHVSRESANEMPAISGCALGVTFRGVGSRFAEDWYDYAVMGTPFIGPYTNTAAVPAQQAKGVLDNRSIGFCSNNPDVLGHRHDQTVASILCHQISIELTPWDGLLSYDSKNPAVLTSNGLCV